jgi:hypothetical protein
MISSLLVTSSKSVLSVAFEAKTSPPSTGITPNSRPSTLITRTFPSPSHAGEPHAVMRSSILPPSPREYPILGLNLIRLLTLNRIADFHTLLESLPSKDLLHENKFIRHPVDLERRLMEGSYSKVWNARDEAPAEEYKFFVDSLMGTIRSVFHFLYGCYLNSFQHPVTKLRAVTSLHMSLYPYQTLLPFYSSPDSPISSNLRAR